MSIWLQARYGLRSLWRRPALTSARVGLLGLGIAATIASFSLAHTLTVNPVGAGDPERLISLGRNSVSYPDLVDLQSYVGPDPLLAGWANANVVVGINGEKHSARASLVTRSYGLVFQPPMVRGLFLDESTKGRAELVVSARLAGRLAASGKTIDLGTALNVNGVPFVVTGIAAARFLGPTLEYVPDLWIPLEREASVRPSTAALQLLGRRNVRWLGGSARLSPGTSPETASDRIASAVRDLKLAHPDETRAWTPAFGSLAVDAIPSDVRKSVMSVASLLIAVALMALIIAAASNCMLLLVANEARASELAIARSLGASRARLLSLLLSESLVVSMVGLGAGLLIANWYLNALRGIRVSKLISVDAHFVWDFTALAAIAAFVFVVPVVVSLLPGRQMTEGRSFEVLKRRSATPMFRRGPAATLRVLVIAQVAIGSALVSGTLILQKASDTLSQGINLPKDGLLLVPIRFDPTSSVPDAQTQVQSIKANLEKVPGVTSVAWGLLPPLAEVNLLQKLRRVGSSEAAEVSGNEVDRDYFQTVGLPFVAGGTFGSSSERDVVLNETAAISLVPDRKLPSEIEIASPYGNRMLRVTGIVPDAKYFTLDELPRPFVYFKIGHSPVGASVLHVRTAGDAGALAGEIQRAVRTATDAPIGEIFSLRESIDLHLARAQFLAKSTLVFCVIAVAAAMAGLFGCLSQFAVRREREIGMRLALGATRFESAKPLIRDAVVIAGLGVGAGVPLAWMFGRTISSQLYRVEAISVGAIIVGAILVIVCCLPIVVLPLRKAWRFDARVLLRAE